MDPATLPAATGGGGKGKLIGMAVVFVPLFIWLAFCLYGVADWVRNGREKTNKRSYIDNRAR